MADLGYTKFIVCHDADGPDPAISHEKVMKRIVEPSGLAASTCVLIPVQELEAWLLADVKAVTRIFTSWKPKAVAKPESIPSPKEHLERLSEDQNRRRRYSHAIHNEQLAERVDLNRVERLCRSFRPLVAFVTTGGLTPASGKRDDPAQGVPGGVVTL